MTGPFRFAWAGATVQPQTTLITNGNTHGGVVQQVSITGDIRAGYQQLMNLASNQDLQVGAFYTLSGPGIAGGTFFIYDDSILIGFTAGSINLSAAPGSTLNSATFLVTKPIPIGELVGNVSHGSDTIAFLDAGGLLAGTYGITGAGIGETNTPIGTTSGTGTSTSTSGTGITIVGSAYFRYDGSSGLAHMRILVATPHTTSGLDSFGQLTQVTTYTISEQAVRATASGQFAYLITGAPDSDWYTVTDIPPTALSSLTPGLRYNITGNGIANDATFVAPAPGATSIELDQAASSSDLNAILTITGPRTPNEAFDPSLHDREDEQIFAFEIEQEEGNFATLSIDIKNPGVGLLAVGRNLWCWLSYDQNWTPDGSAPVDLVPLFNGRLIGVPKRQAGELVKLQFLARPDDFNAQKQAIYNTLAVLPYYDPVWLASNVSFDTVLETMSAHWHINRTTLTLTTSDILIGEDGTVTIGEDLAFYDNFSLDYNAPPLIAVTVSGTVSWQQEGDGIIDVTPKIIQAFSAQGSPYGSSFPTAHGNPGSGGGGLIVALCGDGLKSSWPAPGTNIGGGWSLSTQNDPAGYPYCYCLEASRNTSGGYLTPTSYLVKWAGIPTSAAGAFPALGVGSYAKLSVSLPMTTLKVRMNLRYAANRRRTETVTAVMTANVQKELSDTSDQDREQINFTSEYVSMGVDANGTVPIGALATRSYFQTDRGAKSFEYLMLAARAKLRARSRAVDVSFATDFRTALGISLRNSVTYFDRRLPGGSATGKVKQYRLTVGDAGMMGEFTIGCAIGTGDPSTAQTGTNSYVEDLYVDPGYQVVSGQQGWLINDELAYESLDDFVIDDDGIDLNNMSLETAFGDCRVSNGLHAQLSALAPLQNSVTPMYGDPLGIVRSLTTTVTLDMRPVAGGEFHTDFFPAVSELAIPKTIDLEAPSELEALWDAGSTVWDQGESAWDRPQ